MVAPGKTAPPSLIAAKEAGRKAPTIITCSYEIIYIVNYRKQKQAPKQIVQSKIRGIKVQE